MLEGFVVTMVWCR